jgi:hypothetical protein
MKPTRIRTVWVVTIALLLVTTSVASARNANPGILPPNSRVQGLTYGEWSAQFLQYALTIPASQSPFTGATGTNCIFKQVGNVAMIIGDWAINEPLECQVPPGTMLFFLLVGSECSTLEPEPWYGGNEAELTACAQSFVTENLQASIDGVEVQNLDQYLFTTPLYEFTLPEDNIFGLTAGTTGESVGYGAWLLLAPLNPGMHTIYLYGSLPSMGFESFQTYELTVTR